MSPSRRSLLVLPLALAGCNAAGPLVGQLYRPFQPANKAQNPMLLEPPAQLGIMVRPPEDMAPEKGRELAEAIALQLQNLGYPASAHTASRESYQLVARLGGAGSNPGERILTAELVNSRNRVLFRHQTGLSPQELNAPAGRTDWTALAQDMAQAVDAKIQQVWAEQNAATRPPVAFGRVTGLNDQAVADVVAGVRWALQRQRQRVVDQPTADSALLYGRIELERTNPATVTFNVTWTLTRLDGREMGTARQQNDVAVSLLETGWNQVVLALAQGAADGIGQVLDRSPLTVNTPITPALR